MTILPVTYPARDVILMTSVVFSCIQLYLNACARAILFCARALLINLIDVCI